MKVALIKVIPYVFSADEIILLNGIAPWSADHWSKSTNALKGLRQRIRDHLLGATNQKCCYCGLSLNVTSSPRIDHVAPKSKYEQFTYEAKNLVPSCQYCNEYIKKDKDTVSLIRDIYDDCEFSIVHPVLDNIEEHINIGAFIIVGITEKGRESIRLFELTNGRRMRMRKLEIISERVESLPLALKELFQSIRSYIPK